MFVDISEPLLKSIMHADHLIFVHDWYAQVLFNELLPSLMYQTLLWWWTSVLQVLLPVGAEPCHSGLKIGACSFQFNIMLITVVTLYSDSNNNLIPTDSH